MRKKDEQIQVVLVILMLTLASVKNKNKNKKLIVLQQVTVVKYVLNFVHIIINELRKLVFEETQVNCFKTISI